MQTNKINSTAVVCVYWYTGLSLACYLEHIRVVYVVGENILSCSVCLASSGFEKIEFTK